MRKKKTFIIAGAIMLMAAVAMTGVYMANREKRESKQIAEQENPEQLQAAENKDTEEPAEGVTKVLQPKKKNTARDTKKEENKAAEVKAVETKETETAVKDTRQGGEEVKDVIADQTPELHFGADSSLNWPLQGNVVLNYSMDQTVYFATLDQYKYNPAVIIAGNVNDRVSSAAPGKIADISTNEVTGCTVTVDLGDGYSASYGQLKEVPYQIGDYVENGSTIGFVSEPTKYYSVEGSNLYFELQKDGTPVNPVDFFQ